MLPLVPEKVEEPNEEDANELAASKEEMLNRQRQLAAIRATQKKREEDEAIGSLGNDVSPGCPIGNTGSPKKSENIKPEPVDGPTGSILVEKGHAQGGELCSPTPSTPTASKSTPSTPVWKMPPIPVRPYMPVPK